MATTTNLDTLVINYLTQAQYDALSTKNANEIYLTPDASITEVIAGTGLTGGGTFGSLTINHSNLVTAQNTQAVYPIKIDAQGHISAYGNAISIPTKLSDLTNDSGFVTSDENVKQTPSTTDAIYELLFSGSADNTLHTEGARKSIGLRYNPYSKVLINDGEIKAQTGTFTSLKTENLTTNTATVVGLLDVKGQLHSNSWTNANIANIGGSFYITPTIEPTDSQAKITITRNSATSWTVTLSGTFATNTIKTGTNSSGVAWPANSLVLITGNITVNNIEYPLGTLRGTLNSSVTATASGTSKTVTLTGVTDGQGNTTPAILQKLYELNGNANISNATFTSGKISLYQIGSYPVGIQMTAMGTNANSMIEIYGGVSTQPNVRIGHLEGIPEFNHKLTTDTSVNNNKKYYTYNGGNFTVVNNPSGNPQTNGWYEADEPKGWGIYTDNGYFTGVIVANAGKIGRGANAWMIGNDENTGKATIYTGIRGAADSASMSTGIGTEDIGSSGILNATNDGYWAFTAGASFGVTTKGKLYANQAHIKGSIDATSFIVKDRNNNNIATFNSDGISFGDGEAGIHYIPSTTSGDIGSLYITGDNVYFSKFIEAIEGPIYYQYTPGTITYDVLYNSDNNKYYYIDNNNSLIEISYSDLDKSGNQPVTVIKNGITYYQYTTVLTYDVWYDEGATKYYYTDINGDKQEVAVNNLDKDTQTNELITVRKNGLNPKTSDLSTIITNQSISINEIQKDIDENEKNINLQNDAISSLTIEQATLTNNMQAVTTRTETVENIVNDYTKGIIINNSEPEPSITVKSDVTVSGDIINGAVKITPYKTTIKGEGNTVSWIDSESFNAKRMISSDIRPRHMAFNSNNEVSLTGTFTILGRENGHMSIIKTTV